MAIGLYGGTFNPFHNGHLGIIRHVKSEFDLDTVFLIPSAIPPHKPETNLAPAKFRYQMVQESIEKEKGLKVSDKELLRKGPSFTMDTISEFRQEYPEENKIFLLMGSDAFLDITTWERKDQIFETVEIIIMLRGKWDDFSPITKFINTHISNDYTPDKTRKGYHHSHLCTIHICRVPRIDISSSMIRKKIRCRESITGLVPPCVETLINTKEIYQ